MEVTLYTTNCPKCKVLEQKLKQKGIEFEVVDDQELMIEKGFMEAPKLEVDGRVMNYGDAMNWIK